MPVNGGRYTCTPDLSVAPAGEPQHERVGPRWGTERGAGHLVDDAGVEAPPPPSGTGCAGVFEAAGDVTGEHEMGAHEPAAGRDEPAHERGGHAEGRVRDDVVRAAR